MAGKKDKNKPPLSKQDAEIWKAVTKDVQRLPGRDYAEPDEDNAASPVGTMKERAGIQFTEPAKQPKGREVDQRTAQRLARGKMKIEGTLDLHGMTQNEAREALTRFIKGSYSRGRRCVLVITGKGRDGKPGILKSRVPEWLAGGELGDIVLQTAQAKQQDGGLGAIYVLLRRNKA